MYLLDWLQDWDFLKFDMIELCIQFLLLIVQNLCHLSDVLGISFAYKFLSITLVFTGESVES